MKKLSSANLFLVIAAIAVGIYGWYNYQNPLLIIEWETKTELNVAGYRVLRRSNPQDNFEIISYEIIPPSPDPSLGGSYTYEDNTVEPGQTYEYLLEEIESTGVINQHGPLEAAVTSTPWAEIASVVILLAGAFLINKKI